MNQLVRIYIWVYFFSINLFPLLNAQENAQDFLKVNIVKIDIHGDLEDSHGTGIVIGQKDNKTYILTAAHVLNEAEKIEVSFFRDSGSYIAQNIAEHQFDLDMAVLIAEDIPLKFVALRLSNTYVPGEDIWTVGHPYGNEWRINHGKNYLQEANYQNENCKLAINEEGNRSGSSGGAIYNADYGLLAMITAVNSLDAVGIKLPCIKSRLDSLGMPTNYLDDSGVLPGLKERLFEREDTYNILLLPFGVLGRCDQDQLYCERAVANRIVKINDEQGLDIDVQILSGYNGPGYTLNYDEGRELGKNHDADLVIWGDYETRCSWDTTMINIRYVSLDNLPNWLEPKFVGTNGETGFQSIYSLSALSEGIMTGDVETIVYWSLAHRRYSKHNYSKAIDLLLSIETREKKEYAGVYLFRGIVFKDLKDFQNALKNMNTAIKINPVYSHAYNIRGIIWGDLDSLAKAHKDYDKAINLNPQFIEAYNNRGNLLAQLKQFDNALLDFNKAIELNPYYALAYMNKGKLFHIQKKEDQALIEYTKSTTLDPNSFLAYNNRGTLFYDMGEWAKALRDYDHTISLNPNYYYAYSNKGYLLSKMGNIEEGVNNISKAIEINPKFTSGYYLRSKLYYSQNKIELSLKDMNSAITIEPNNIDLYLNRSVIYIELMELEKLLLDLKMIYELDVNEFMVPPIIELLRQPDFNPYRQDPRFRQIFELAKE